VTPGARGSLDVVPVVPEASVLSDDGVEVSAGAVVDSDSFSVEQPMRAVKEARASAASRFIAMILS